MRLRQVLASVPDTGRADHCQQQMVTEHLQQNTLPTGPGAIAAADQRPTRGAVPVLAGAAGAGDHRRRCIPAVCRSFGLLLAQTPPGGATRGLGIRTRPLRAEQPVLRREARQFEHDLGFEQVPRNPDWCAFRIQSVRIEFWPPVGSGCVSEPASTKTRTASGGAKRSIPE